MKKWNFAYIPEISNEKLMNYFENNLNLNSDQIEALSIGVTVILFNAFEMFLVLFLSYFLGVLKESILFCIMFIPLRMFAAGIHCKSGHACIITTLIFYLGSSLLSKYCPLQNTLMFFISINFPSLIIPILSAIFFTSFRLWDENNMVFPFSFSFFKMS